MSKIRISAVSYTNTLPFLQGIKASAALMEQIDLSVDYPSECARKVLADEADMGIIPIAALAAMDNYQLIGDYCIGSDGAVDSVFIFSEKPIQEIKSLRLDPESRTSNGLARILLKHYWKVEVAVVTTDEADAYVLIGDRTFGKKDTVPYAYDLGQYWKEMTGLPFAYAVWASKKTLPSDFIEAFNTALAAGVAAPENVIPGLPIYAGFDYKKYFTVHLDYHLTAQKREAVERYLTLYKAL